MLLLDDLDVISDVDVVKRDWVTVHAADRGRNVDLHRVGDPIPLQDEELAPVVFSCHDAAERSPIGAPRVQQQKNGEGPACHKRADVHDPTRQANGRTERRGLSFHGIATGKTLGSLAMDRRISLEVLMIDSFQMSGLVSLELAHIG